VDAAASAENALLPRYWDQEQDALEQDWSQEIVWCNPPYSRPAPFLVKASTACLAVILMRADCLTTHYTSEFPPSYLAVPKGRLSFDRPPGQSATGEAAPFGSVLFLYGGISDTQIRELREADFQVWKHHGET
jgi:phage N-6-adenine-methyltransferase